MRARKCNLAVFVEYVKSSDLFPKWNNCVHFCLNIGFGTRFSKWQLDTFYRVLGTLCRDTGPNRPTQPWRATASELRALRLWTRRSSRRSKPRRWMPGLKIKLTGIKHQTRSQQHTDTVFTGKRMWLKKSWQKWDPRPLSEEINPILKSKYINHSRLECIVQTSTWRLSLSVSLQD